MFSRFAPSVLGSAASVFMSVLASGCATDLERRVDRSMAGIPTQALPAAMAAHERAYGAPAHVAERGGQLQRSRQLVRFVQSPWVGGIQTVARTERRLPAIFDENFVLDFGESHVPISVVAARLARLTNLPVRVPIDDGGKGASGAAGATTVKAVLPTPLPTPITGLPMAGGNAPGTPAAAPAVGGPPASAVSSDTDISVNAVGMKWNGWLRDFLDHLSNTLSLSWEYRDGAVVLMRLITQRNAVAALHCAQDFSTTMGGGGSGTAGASNASMLSQATTAVHPEGSDGRAPVAAAGGAGIDLQGAGQQRHLGRWLRPDAGGHQQGGAGPGARVPAPRKQVAAHHGQRDLRPVLGQDERCR